MYEEYFGFAYQPFGEESAAEFLVLTGAHRDALEEIRRHLSANAAGLVLIGDAGVGKTAVLRALCQKAALDADVQPLYIPEPVETADQPFAWLLAELGLEADTGGGQDALGQIERALAGMHARGQWPCLLIDEAQTLSEAGIQALTRVLSLFVGERRACQVVLAGPVVLANMVLKSAPGQPGHGLWRRIDLAPMSPEDTSDYIMARTRRAGGDAESLFDARAMRSIHDRASGNARLVNTLCDICLASAFDAKQRKVDRSFALDAMANWLDFRAGPPSLDDFVFREELEADATSDGSSEPVAPETASPRTARGGGAQTAEDLEDTEDGTAQLSAFQARQSRSLVDRSPPKRRWRFRSLAATGVGLSAAASALIAVEGSPWPKIRNMAPFALFDQGSDADDMAEAEVAAGSGETASSFDLASRETDQPAKTELSRLPEQVARALVEDGQIAIRHDRPATGTRDAEGRPNEVRHAALSAGASVEQTPSETAGDDPTFRSKPAADVPLPVERVIPPDATRLPSVPSDPALSEAMFRSALQLEDPQDTALAYARAAAAGHGRAAYFLGQMYDTGDGVVFAPDLARAWYAVAAGDVAAAARLLAEAQDPSPSGEPFAEPLLAAPNDGVVELVWQGRGPFVVELAREPDLATAYHETTLSAVRLPADPDIAWWRVTPRGVPPGEWIRIHAMEPQAD